MTVVSSKCVKKKKIKKASPLWRGGKSLTLGGVRFVAAVVTTSTSLRQFLQLNNPHWWLVTFSCRSLQVQYPDRPLWKDSLAGPLAVRSHQLACHSPAVARAQLPVWAVLSMLSNEPPSCCVVTSIWSSLARQISMPVRSLQQALLCKFNYSSVPYYCWLTAPRTNFTLTVSSHFLLTKKYLIYSCFAIPLYH